MSAFGHRTTSWSRNACTPLSVTKNGDRTQFPNRRMSPSKTLVPFATLFAILGCSSTALDLGDDGSVGFTNPPRAADGTFDETVPWTIATETWSAGAVGVDASRVYWSAWDRDYSAQKLRSCVPDDCARTLITYQNSQYAGGFATTTSNLYWRGGSGVRTCPIKGCSGDPLALNLRPAMASTIVDFAIGDGSLYSLLTDATVQKCPLSGCPAETDAELVAALDANPIRLASDDATLYVSTTTGPIGAIVANPNARSQFVRGSGSIVAIPKDHSRPARVIATGPFYVAGLAVNSSNVYWTDGYAGTVSTCPLSGCTEPPLVIANVQSPGNLLVDERNAYFIPNIDHSTVTPPTADYFDIVECPLEGCLDSPRVLVSGTIATGALAQDADHLYWTTRGEKWGTAPAGSPASGILEVLGNGGVNRILK